MARVRKTALIIIILAAGGVCLLLLIADPDSSKFYPPCLFHKITGWHCSGCGATRAIYHLLHGRLGEACARNVLLVILLPLMGAWAIGRLLEQYHVIKMPVLPAWSIWTLLVVIVLYGVARNLPWHPFNLLAPQ